MNQKTRKWIFKLHLAVGLTAGLVLTMSGLTGSLLLFDDEIDRALNPGLLRAAPGAGRATTEEAVAAVRRAYPDEKLARVRLPRDPEGVYEVCLSAKTDPRCVYVDPHTARVLGSRVPAQSLLKGRIFSLHRRLLSGETGETVIGVVGLLLVLLAATGVYLWWPGRGRVRHGLKLERRARGRQFSLGVHRLAGISAMLFLALIGLTGAAMAFGPTSERLFNLATASPPRRPAPSSVPQAGLAPPTLDALLERAEAALPGAETVVVQLPQTPTAPYTVRKRLPGEWHPNGRSVVHLDQYSGAVLQVEDALRAPAGTRLVGLLYPLHTGRLAGDLTRVVHLFVGLAPGLLFTTGLLMWRQRVRGRRRRASLPSTATPGLETAGD